MTDLIRGSCRDALHLARGWLISRAANGPTVTISLRLGQKTRSRVCRWCRWADSGQELFVFAKHNSLKKRNQREVIDSMRECLHVNPFFPRNRSDDLYPSPLNPNSPLLVKLTNFSIFPFLSKIFVQNCEVFPWFYRSDIAVWNALLSRASEG